MGNQAGSKIDFKADSQNDFENKTCLKFLKTSFIGEKYPLFPLKKMSIDWDLIYHIMTSLYLSLFPRVFKIFAFSSIIR